MHNMRIHETVANIASKYRKPITEGANETDESRKKAQKEADDRNKLYHKMIGVDYNDPKALQKHDKIHHTKRKNAKAQVSSLSHEEVINQLKESEEVEDKTKNADTEHDEAKETQEDPTREKLETPKDEADEKKGGPAELAADLRVSIRIEKMGIGRYKRMLTKHELSDDDEKWLKQRITDLEACIKAMEDKLPALEKEAEGKSEDIKESIKFGIKKAVMELVTGK